MKNHTTVTTLAAFSEGDVVVIEPGGHYIVVEASPTPNKALHTYTLRRLGWWERLWRSIAAPIHRVWRMRRYYKEKRDEKTTN